ncbi:MAG: hypothetical protein JRI35_07780 [Deltaproteobacteria bacterium]|nr:hypothetical protein [Deltaproteobacteria bacterium]
MNPLYPALERLPFSGFQGSLIADRRGSAIRPAIETLQKADRSCGRARMATSTADQGFTGIFTFTGSEFTVLGCFSFQNPKINWLDFR